MRIIALIGEKGGIGKTTTAMSVAAGLSQVGKTVVVDADPQNSATKWHRKGHMPFALFTVAHKVDITPEQTAEILAGLRESPELQDAEYVIIDTAPLLAATKLAAAQVADLVICPTQAASLDLDALIDTIQEVVIPSGVLYAVLLTLLDSRSSQDTSEAREQLAEAGVPVFQTGIRRLVAHKRAPQDGIVLTQYPLNSISNRNAIDDYRELIIEALARLGQSATAVSA